MKLLKKLWGYLKGKKRYITIVFWVIYGSALSFFQIDSRSKEGIIMFVIGTIFSLIVGTEGALTYKKSGDTDEQ